MAYEAEEAALRQIEVEQVPILSIYYYRYSIDSHGYL